LSDLAGHVRAKALIQVNFVPNTVEFPVPARLFNRKTRVSLVPAPGILAGGIPPESAILTVKTPIRNWWIRSEAGIAVESQQGQECANSGHSRRCGGEQSWL
jgi:hypothetical protein